MHSHTLGYQVLWLRLRGRCTISDLLTSGAWRMRESDHMRAPYTRISCWWVIMSAWHEVFKWYRQNITLFKTIRILSSFFRIAWEKEVTIIQLNVASRRNFVRLLCFFANLIQKGNLVLLKLLCSLIHFWPKQRLFLILLDPMCVEYLNCIFKLIRDIQFVSVKEQDYPESLIIVREPLDIFVAKLTPSRVFDIIST